MITVKMHQSFLLGLLTHGRVINALRVRTGLPEGCMLVGARVSDSIAYLDFIDGKPGQKTIDVTFDVAVPALVGGGRDS